MNRGECMPFMQPYSIARGDVDDYLLKCGIRPGLLGFVYLGDLISQFCLEPKRMYCGLYAMYRLIGAKYGKGATGIEHACSNAIAASTNVRFSGMLASDFIAYIVITLPKHYEIKPL